MAQVWKYVLGDVETTLEMPGNARVLHVAEQGGAICLWAMVYPEFRKEKRTFAFWGTGHTLPIDTGKFIGTVLVNGGAYVFHVFETT